MLKFKLIIVALLVCVLPGAIPALASITVESTYMDYRGIDPDPDFDWDSSPIWFTQTTDSYLASDDSDINRWHFQGEQEFSYDYSSGEDSTWFLKTGDEKYMNVDKLVINNSGSSFTAYTITLYVATLVEDSLSITGVDFDASISTVTDSYGDVTTTILIVFETPVASGESFELSYILDLSGVEPAPPAAGEYGVDENPAIPEPATMAMLGLGATVLLGRHRNRRNC